MYIAAISDPMIPSITGPGMFATEAKIIGGVVLISLLAPSLFARLLGRIEAPLRALAGRRGLSVLFIGILSLVVRAALLPWLPIPVPGVHDEFSYLLQADTFAHGRLANPTPALWTPFETFHVLFQPSYISKYPPVQGLTLAAGQVLFGHPWFGVWLSIAALCAAICWMLQGWLPPGWALLGGLLAVVRLGTFSYWANSYWGGAVAAVGGALVLGSLPRILRHARVRDSLWMALGVAILANSRPYEGFVLVLATAGVSAVMLVRTPIAPVSPVARLGIRVFLPLAVCLALTVAAMGYYNSRTTGRALIMPYEAYLSQYSMPPALLWQTLPPRTPTYRNAAMTIASGLWEVPVLPYQRSRTFAGLVGVSFSKLQIIECFFLGPALTLPLFMLPWIFRDRRIRPLLWVSGITLAGFLCETWFYPHYAAPATAPIYLIMLQCMRHLRVWTLHRRRTGLMMARLIPIVCLVMLGLRLNADFSPTWTWYGAWPGNISRAQIVERLDKLPGRQLVIVRYSPRHSTDNEWVYNSADIDSSKILWARDQDQISNLALLQQYANRTVWLLEPDNVPPKLVPYAPATEIAASGSASK